MDELAILRGQIATERRHLIAVKGACRAALPAARQTTGADEFARIAGDYLQHIGRRMLAQDHAHVVLLRPRLAAGDVASHRLLDELEATLGQLRTALQALETGTDRIAGLFDYLDFIDSVMAKRRHALEPLLAAHYSIEDWRAAAFVDADSILEERERYAACRAAAPAGAFAPEGET
ncbi:MAG TPA: hypothetical protein PKL49_01630 [Steroidobacteraceae bacterium]|nr:hypothetical protein [Steroidobacteraceae bacterium]HNS28048.1 hypothetical protein [Steroidobacteraceae bacterium]